MASKDMIVTIVRCLLVQVNPLDEPAAKEAPPGKRIKMGTYLSLPALVQSAKHHNVLQQLAVRETRDILLRYVQTGRKSESS